MKTIIKAFSKHILNNSAGKQHSPETTFESAQVDPKLVGFLDADHAGFYQLSGELAPGLKIHQDDIVLDVGCGEALPHTIVLAKEPMSFLPM